MKFKNVREKLLFIEALEEENDDSIQELLPVIEQLSRDKSPDVRSDLAIQLVLFDRDEVEEILYQMLDDKNRHVRLEAVDSLAVGRMPKTIDKVRTMMEGQWYLIRGYAVLRLFDLLINCYGFNEKTLHKYQEYTKDSFQREENEWVKHAYYENQYFCGDESGLCHLEEQYKKVVDGTSNLRVSLFVNTFKEVLNYKNQDQIFSILNYKKDQLPWEWQKEEVDDVLNEPVPYKVLVVDKDNTAASRFAKMLSESDLPEYVQIKSAGFKTDKILELHTYDLVVGLNLAEQEERCSYCHTILFESENEEITEEEWKRFFSVGLGYIKRNLRG